MTNEELVEAYQNGDMNAFDGLLKQNYGIIITAFNKWFSRVCDGVITADELEAECIYLFYLAVDSYKSGKGMSFATWAFDYLQWKLNRFFRQKNTKVQTISLDDIVPGTDNCTFGDMIPDDDAELEMQVPIEKEYQKTLKFDLIQLLEDVLSEREKTVILMAYGIDCKSQTQIQIASALNISRARVGQIQSDAIKKLQASPLTEYFREKYNQNKVSDSEEMRYTKTAMAEVDDKSLSDAVKIFGL